MRKTKWLEAVAVALAGVVLSLHSTWAQTEPAPDSDPGGKIPREIVVRGEGRVAARPDRAILNLGAEAQAEAAASAQATVSAVMAKTVTNLTRLGIPRTAIKTTGLELSPVYSSRNSSSAEAPAVVGYRAANTIEVEIDRLDQAGKAVDVAMAAGINKLEGVSFTLQDSLPQRIQALRLAAAEAKAKAQAIADALGVEITEVSEATEGGVSVAPPRPPFGIRAMAAALPTPVEPGEVRIEASLTVRYRIGGKAGENGK